MSLKEGSEAGAAVKAFKDKSDVCEIFQIKDIQKKRQSGTLIHSFPT